MVRTMRRGVLAWALVALCVGCGAEQIPQMDGGVEEGAVRKSPLEAQMEAAAAEFEVPVAVLKAVAWQESRWSTPPLPAEDHHGHEHAHSYRAYGVMGLRDGAPWRTLQRASALTGLDEDVLVFDRAANIRGAAAVLRALAVDSGAAPKGQLVHEAFFEAVGRYGAGDDPHLAQRYAKEAFGLLSTGLAGYTEEGLPMRIEPQRAVSLPTTLVTHTQALEAEYPGATFDAADVSNFSNISRSPQQVTHITVHVVQGSYAGAISWFKNPTANVSAHYVIRSSDGAITQMVLHEDRAWHVGTENDYTIGIEHEGWVSEPHWFTDEMYRSSAALVRHLAQTWGIALDREHIKGHVEYPNQTHTDPGVHWDWDRYMGYIRQEDMGPPTGNLVGYVRLDDIYNTEAPLEGVTVTLDNGQSATTDANGFYRFDGLQWGTFQITASLEGHRDTTIVRDLEVEYGDTWASMALSALEEEPPVEDPPVDDPPMDEEEPPVDEPPSRDDGMMNDPVDDPMDDAPMDDVPVEEGISSAAQVKGCAVTGPGAPVEGGLWGLLLVLGAAFVGRRRR